MAGQSLLLVLPQYPPAVGGMQTHAAYLCLHLARRGYRLDVLTYRPVESNAAGVPVVATDAGGVPSVVEDGANGLLFRPDDADGLVACLERVLAGGPVVERMVAEGRRRARERFDWSVVTDLHEQVFRRHLMTTAGAGPRGRRLVPALG